MAAEENYVHQVNENKYTASATGSATASPSRDTAAAGHAPKSASPSEKGTASSSHTTLSRETVQNGGPAAQGGQAPSQDTHIASFASAWGDSVKQGPKASPEASAPAAAQKAKPTRFSQAVRDRFGSIDTDNNGFLSEAEVDRAMKNKWVQDENAAAIATLNVTGNDLQALSNDEYGKENDGVTLKDLAEYEKRSKAGKDKTAEAVDAQFQSSLSKLRQSPKQLYTGGTPDPGAVSQGQIGDCYYLSALSAKAYQDPQAVKNMIKDNGDGTFTVSHPGQKEVTIQAPTESEVAQYSGSGNDGRWLSVMEKGYGDLRNQGRWSQKAVPQDAADGGASLATGIRAVTGHDVDTVSLKGTDLSTTRDTLEKALREGKVVTAATAGENKSLTNKGLVGNHAYSVIGYDRKNDTITLRNPWGSGETLNANGTGPLDGRDDGKFTLTPAQFHHYFSSYAYEE